MSYLNYPDANCHKCKTLCKCDNDSMYLCPQCGAKFMYDHMFGQYFIFDNVKR